mmetsp:Transcript_16061/g.27687  ORF Transcript_16061/g.27687 Transcript_16061/m.27687 type:complete len:218 (+) Transcript_16061:115-768(+)
MYSPKMGQTDSDGALNLSDKNVAIKFFRVDENDSMQDAHVTSPAKISAKVRKPASFSTHVANSRRHFRVLLEDGMQVTFNAAARAKRMSKKLGGIVSKGPKSGKACNEGTPLFGPVFRDEPSSFSDPSNSNYFFFSAAAALAFLVPRTFFALFFLSFLCFLEPVFASAIPARTSLYFGSNFLADSSLSYTRAKPVDLPPPKAVLKPKRKTWFGSFTL